jgi:hypothetical protein
MGTESEERKAKQELTDLEVFKVDIVDKPATGDTFLQLRSEDSEGEKMPRRRTAISRNLAKELITALSEPDDNIEQESVIERQVPDATATPEKKREAQKKRATKYGIEVLENKGENLSYPKGDPTKESLYADGVNLKYPLGKSDNKVDKNRANNARARFKQSFAVYTKTSSRKIIHTNIVKAQLKAGSKPSYDPDDPLDKLLPKEVKDKIEKPVERTETETETQLEETRMTLEEKVDLLTKSIERMEGVFSGVLQSAQVAQTEETGETTAETETDKETQETAPETPPDATESQQEQGAQSGQTETETSTETASAPSGEVQIQVPGTAVIAAMQSSVEKAQSTIERAMTTFEAQLTKISEQLTAITGRVDKVERSIKTGGNSQPQDSTESIDRGGKKSMWEGVL